MSDRLRMRSLEELDCAGRRVLARVDINSPLDPETHRIINTNRIEKSLPTLSHLLGRGARLGILAHQGDTLNYKDLVPLTEHADILTRLLGREVRYIDDVAGPAAVEAVKELEPGRALLLGNVRYLTEEVSSFEAAVPLEPEQMLDCLLVRRLAPLFDVYVNDAFAAAHRKAPSMVAFQEIMPSAAGRLLFSEVKALQKVMESPAKPAVFLLGGLKISDAFSMMLTVLKSGAADAVLTCGVTGVVMLMAQGVDVGDAMRSFIADRGLDAFIKPAAEHLREYPDKIMVPSDLACDVEGRRVETAVDDLPGEGLYPDIGAETIKRYADIIARAGTVFVNGPPGVYENDAFAHGSRELFRALAASKAYTVVGGGDSVSAAARFINLDDLDYVCTAGGAMVRFLSGVELPLLTAMEKASSRSFDN